MNVHHISATVNYSETLCRFCKIQRLPHADTQGGHGEQWYAWCGCHAIPLTLKIEVEDVDLLLNCPIRTCPQYSHHIPGKKNNMISILNLTILEYT